MKRAANAKRGSPEVSPDGKRRAAVVLEVLAGVRTPQQAAEVLGLSLPGFYQLEDRATLQLQYGCEARRRGRQANGESKMAALVKEVERLQQEVARYQTLVRLTQRTVGVRPAAPPGKAAGSKRKRKPVVRAMRRAERLRAQADQQVGAEATQEGTE
jgi:hypothetical protein